jgi:hypothetical protein
MDDGRYGNGACEERGVPDERRRERNESCDIVCRADGLCSVEPIRLCGKGEMPRGCAGRVIRVLWKS